MNKTASQKSIMAWVTKSFNKNKLDLQNARQRFKKLIKQVDGLDQKLTLTV